MKPTIATIIIPGALAAIAWASAAHAAAPEPFWPDQAVPAGIVQTTNHEYFRTFPPAGPEAPPEEAFGATHMLVQSISGLAARAVNEGRGDEMVWIEVGHPEMHLNPAFKLGRDYLLARLDAEERGAYGAWELVERYMDMGIVQGYILYRYDPSEGGFEEIRDGMDLSVNLATSLAPHLDAVLVEERLEPAARALGLELLYDARDRDIAEEMRRHANLFNTSLFGILDPRVPNQRDYLIAHGAAVHYGYDDLMDEMLARLEPLTPIIGWNGGDERRHTRHVSEFGHFNTASNRVINLPLFSAGARQEAARLEPWPGRFSDAADGPATAFVMSDGDNLSWFIGEIANSPDYMGNPQVDHRPISWTGCLATLIQLSPDTYRAILDNAGPNAGMSEFSGGYFFPEVFGDRRSEPDLLREYARRVSPFLEASGMTVFHFMTLGPSDSEEALAAYQVFAEELRGIDGMTLTEYAPYEGGEGRVHWVENADGEPIPVVTAGYSVWEGRPTDRRGAPAHIAARIAEHAAGEGDGYMSWVVIHAWSHFPVDGTMRRGVEPVWEALDALDEAGIEVLAIEDLVRRIRRAGPPQ